MGMVRTVSPTELMRQMSILGAVSFDIGTILRVAAGRNPYESLGRWNLAPPDRFHASTSVSMPAMRKLDRILFLVMEPIVFAIHGERVLQKAHFNVKTGTGERPSSRCLCLLSKLRGFDSPIWFQNNEIPTGCSSDVAIRFSVFNAPVEG